MSLPEDLCPLPTLKSGSSRPPVTPRAPVPTCAHTPHTHEIKSRIKKNQKNSPKEDSGSLLKHFQGAVGGWGDGSALRALACLTRVGHECGPPTLTQKAWRSHARACDPSAEGRSLLGHTDSLRTSWRRRSPSSLWDPGIKLRSSSVVTSIDTHRAHTPEMGIPFRLCLSLSLEVTEFFSLFCFRRPRW